MIAFWIGAAVWLAVLFALTVRAAVDAADGRIVRSLLVVLLAVAVLVGGGVYVYQLGEVPS